MLGTVVMLIVCVAAIELNLLDALGSTNLSPDFIGIAKARIRQCREDEPPQQRKKREQAGELAGAVRVHDVAQCSSELRAVNFLKWRPIVGYIA